MASRQASLQCSENRYYRAPCNYQKRTSVPDTKKVVTEFRMARPPISKTTKYLGNAWDEFIGMIYLMYKYPENCIAIPDVLLNKKREFRFDPYNIEFSHTSLGWSEKKSKF